MIAILLAGGTGRRMGEKYPKQFIKLEDGLTILEHSYQAIVGCRSVEEVCVVTHRDWMEETRRCLDSRKENGKKTHYIIGGEERWQSAKNGVNYYAQKRSDDPVVLIHDAARPYLSTKLLEELSRIMESTTADVDQRPKAMAVGIPSTDTVWEIDPDKMIIKAIPNREKLWRAQTPQAFRLSVLKEVYEKAKEDPQVKATDDCGMVIRYAPEVEIHILRGEENNVKITHPTDLK